MKITERELLEIHRWMVLERYLDEKVNELFRMGKIMTMFHSIQGHEAAMVGAAFALQEGDAFAPPHRGKVIYLMRGYALNFLMAGLFGRKKGLGHGLTMAGSHMMGDPRIGLLPASGCIGASSPVAMGAALALKLQHKPNAALVYLGDGGSSRGDVHEAMNMASALKLPVVFFVINNGWALSVRASYGVSVKNISDRAAGYSMPGVTVDGRDVLSVYETVAEALERARQGGGPSLIEAKVDRWTAHSVNDPEVYRTDEERALARRRDPIREYEDVLRQRQLLEDGGEARVLEQVRTEVEAAIRHAEQCAEPDPEDMLSAVYESGRPVVRG